MAEAATVIALGLGVWERSGATPTYGHSDHTYTPRPDGRNNKLTGDFGSYYNTPMMHPSELPESYLDLLRLRRAAIDEQMKSKPN